MSGTRSVVSRGEASQENKRWKVSDICISFFYHISDRPSSVVSYRSAKYHLPLAPIPGVTSFRKHPQILRSSVIWVARLLYGTWYSPAVPHLNTDWTLNNFSDWTGGCSTLIWNYNEYATRFTDLCFYPREMGRAVIEPYYVPCPFMT